MKGQERKGKLLYLSLHASRNVYEFGGSLASPRAEGSKGQGECPYLALGRMGSAGSYAPRGTSLPANKCTPTQTHQFGRRLYKALLFRKGAVGTKTNHNTDPTPIPAHTHSRNNRHPTPD